MSQLLDWLRLHFVDADEMAKETLQHEVPQQHAKYWQAVSLVCQLLLFNISSVVGVAGLPVRLSWTHARSHSTFDATQPQRNETLRNNYSPSQQDARLQRNTYLVSAC